MMRNATVASSSGVQLEAGSIIARGVIPGYVVLSFFISYIGSWTTLELINRRTSSKGRYNWFLLVGAAISMGGIGIWCMHFIGNRAIILGNGAIDIQISYSGGFTAISFFLPIIVLFMAFAAVGSNEEIRFVRLGLGGTLAGLGICGMHYLGQAGIRNYDCIYYVSYVIGAAIIAITAATAALGIFFVFRATWNATWWKRGICAIILSSAVSGMHWLASVGTKYRTKPNATFTSNNSRNATTISVIVLSIGGCIILLVSTLLAQAQKKSSAKRSHQVTLATAVFDQDGRILVEADGLLPTKKITDAYREKNINDVFGVSHPAFLWMFRVTRNWSGISSLVPGMREHLHRAGLRNRLGMKSGEIYINEEGAPVADYSIIFRELFCAAAAELADDMKQPIDKLGVLYDDIVVAGKKPSRANKTDLEGGQAALGNGQLLFLVRVVDRHEAQHLQAVGYRFAAKPNIIPMISGILQIPRDDLARQLESMQEFAKEPTILEPGCHLALFAVRANMRSGFDILARKDARNQLPTMQLPFDVLESWQVDYLKTLETQTVVSCLKQLNKASRAAVTPPKEKEFASQILHTLEALKDEIEDHFFNDAMLIAKPIQAPCRGVTEDSPPGTCTLIVFLLIIPIHSHAPGQKLDFTSLAFFNMLQHIYKNSRDHAVFARTTYREFAPILNLSGHSNIADGARRKGAFHFSSTPFTPGGRRGYSKHIFSGRRDLGKDARVKGDNSSEKNLVRVNSEDQGLGGILVSQEVSIDVANRPASSITDDYESKPGGIEMEKLSGEPKTGFVSKASKEEGETLSYIDELFKIAIATKTLGQ